MLSKKTANPAFTIVELLVVIVVIGILAAISLVAYNGISNRAIISSMQSDLTNASITLKLDYTSNSTFPATLALANNGKGITPSQSLDSIIYIPDNTSNPNNFCLQYRKGLNNYAVDNTSSVSSGVCLQNLVVNGDFSTGATGWGANASTHAVASNTLTNTANGSQVYGQEIQTLAFTSGHKYYVRVNIRATNLSCTVFSAYDTQQDIYKSQLNPIQNTWYVLSYAGTAGVSNASFIIRHTYVDAATANGKAIEVQYVSVVDLTVAFGASNEPTQAQMDTIMSTYPNSWFNIVAKANF